jgi:hypothetical protein
VIGKKIKISSRTTFELLKIFDTFEEINTACYSQPNLEFCFGGDRGL